MSWTLAGISADHHRHRADRSLLRLRARGLLGFERTDDAIALADAHPEALQVRSPKARLSVVAELQARPRDSRVPADEC